MSTDGIMLKSFCSLASSEVMHIFLRILSFTKYKCTIAIALSLNNRPYNGYRECVANAID
jgi:hypothetical protein